MVLDVTTLTFIGGLITLSSGLFLLGFWFNDRTARSALLWSIANCGLGTGVLLLSLGTAVPFLVSRVAAPFLIDFSSVLTLFAAWSFNRHSMKRSRTIAFVTVMMWIGIHAVGGLYDRIQYAAGAAVVLSGCFYAAAALDFWLARAEKLRGRIPMIMLLVLHTTARFLLGIKIATAMNIDTLPSVGVLGIINFVFLVYAIGVTLLLILMLNRGEEKYKNDAVTDPLTGLVNRRGFLDKAQRLLDRAARDRSPVGVLAFDLDRFKVINDTYGHGIGDKVLLVFAAVLTETLRPNDIAARLGGEEFIALIPGAGNELAVAIANRVREAFQRAAQFVDGHRVGATVSVGIAAGLRDGAELAEAMASADAALYCAKNAGRNRVSLYSGGPDTGPSDNIIRIA
jgi:diguanylate cyclase (GGDEF)-like protein